MGSKHPISSRLTNLARAEFELSSNLKEKLVGLYLGDLAAQKRGKISNNVRLRFAQGITNEAYLLHLFDLFKGYCVNSPKRYDFKPDKRTGNIYTQISFTTYSLPCFNELYQLYYLNGKKIVPKNITELLTPAGLAYWAMDDGAKLGSGFTLCTDSYSLTDVELLIKALNDNFNLKCTIHKSKNNYRIYILSKSVDKFKDLVSPYFHDSMKYKLK